MDRSHMIHASSAIAICARAGLKAFAADGWLTIRRGSKPVSRTMLDEFDSVSRHALARILDDQPKRWGVWCTVSGGVTGERAAWLKEEGAPRIFETEGEAEAEAARLAGNVSPHSRCTFSYAARERT